MISLANPSGLAVCLRALLSKIVAHDARPAIDVGMTVEIVTADGCMAHYITKPVSGVVRKLGSWRPLGSNTCHDFALVETAEDLRWHPTHDFVFTSGIFTRAR